MSKLPRWPSGMALRSNPRNLGILQQKGRGPEFKMKMKISAGAYYPKTHSLEYVLHGARITYTSGFRDMRMKILL